jgi:hypothetical protein
VAFGGQGGQGLFAATGTGTALFVGTTA